MFRMGQNYHYKRICFTLIRTKILPGAHKLSLQANLSLQTISLQADFIVYKEKLSRNLHMYFNKFSFISDIKAH